MHVRIWFDDLIETPPSTDKCVEWPFARNSKGYGSVRDGDQSTTAHRLVLLRSIGDPPSGKYVAAHSCHNPGCVNVNHLRWATYSENMEDRKSNGTYPIGEKNSFAKLTAEQVLAIRASDKPSNELAAEFGIVRDYVTQIKRRETWKHI